MTLLEMATEVVAKCGEGYTSYITRAKAALRTATAQAISTGAIPLSEIDGSIKVESLKDWTDEWDEEYKYDLSTPGDATKTVLFTNVEIDQIQNGLYITKVDSKAHLNNANHFRRFNIGSAAGSLIEILYFVDLPYLYMKPVRIPDEEDETANPALSIRLTQVIIPAASYTTDNTQFNTFLNEKAQQIIIDIAAKNLAAEINR